MFSPDLRPLKAVGFNAAISDRYYTNYQTNDAVVGGLTALRAYEIVPWLFRAVNLRANNIASFPLALMKGETDVTDDEAYAGLMKSLRRNLWLAEASKIVTGAGYWAIEANATGRNVTLRWLPSNNVLPRYTTSQGLTLFHFTGNYHEALTTEREIPLDRMIWFWEPNLQSEVQPGPAPAAVALAAASMLYALDAFTANFFNRGAVKVTVFEIPPSTSKADKDEFTNFLQRQMAGVKQAFRMLAVRGGMKPTVIGSDVKETQAPELTALQRDNVAAALGVPASIIDGRSSDESNTRSEKAAFVIDTVIPEMELLAETANEKLFSRLGLELVLHPELLEVMQQVQLDQIASITEAVGGPILTKDEGRALAGYEPLTTAQMEELTPKPPVVMAPQAQPPANEGVELEEAESESEIVAKALGEWRRAALGAVRAGHSAVDVSVSAAIPYRLVRAIDQDLKQAADAGQVRAAFERHWPRIAGGKKAGGATYGDPQLQALIDILHEATVAAKTQPAELELDDVKAKDFLSRLEAIMSGAALPAAMPAIRFEHGNAVFPEGFGTQSAPQVTFAPVLDMQPVADAIKNLGQMPAPIIQAAQTPVTIENQTTVNLPKLKSARAHVVRDTSNLVVGTNTEYEYEKD